MKKRRKARRAGGNEAKPRKIKPIFTSPFRDLGRLLRDRPQKSPVIQQKPPCPPEGAMGQDSDDESLLRAALQGVRQLSPGGPSRLPLEPKITRSIVSEDAEVLAQLSDLVSGQGRFDITETDEYVEGMRGGIDPRLVVRLRRGEFATQAHIDLHGMIQEAAKAALTDFLMESVRKGLRAVLVVHGRGRRSPGGWPVLKHATTQWLSRGALSGYVLAFATARPADGGTGALYVLLKRQRRRAIFDVLNGAKRLG